jgi:hypothetical protein
MDKRFIKGEKIMEAEGRKDIFIRIALDVVMIAGFIVYFLYDELMLPVMYKPLLSFVILISMFFAVVLYVYQFLFRREKRLIVSAAAFLIAFLSCFTRVEPSG